MPWFVVRPTGVCYQADDWSALLDHDDVTRPGRLRAVGYRDEAGRQTAVELAPGEILQLVVRKAIAVGPHTAPPPRLILGIMREDGSGVYLHMAHDGSVTLSSDFEAGG